MYNPHIMRIAQIVVLAALLCPSASFALTLTVTPEPSEAVAVVLVLGGIVVARRIKSKSVRSNPAKGSSIKTL